MTTLCLPTSIKIYKRDSSIPNYVMQNIVIAINSIVLAFAQEWQVIPPNVSLDPGGPVLGMTTLVTPGGGGSLTSNYVTYNDAVRDTITSINFSVWHFFVFDKIRDTNNVPVTSIVNGVQFKEKSFHYLYDASEQATGAPPQKQAVVGLISAADIINAYGGALNPIFESDGVIMTIASALCKEIFNSIVDNYSSLIADTYQYPHRWWIHHNETLDKYYLVYPDVTSPVADATIKVTVTGITELGVPVSVDVWLCDYILPTWITERNIVYDDGTASTIPNSHIPYTKSQKLNSTPKSAIAQAFAKDTGGSYKRIELNISSFTWNFA
jgi:hypothetical protein